MNAQIENIANILIETAKDGEKFKDFKAARAAAFGATDHYMLEDYFDNPDKGKFAKIKAGAKAATAIIEAAVALANEKSGKQIATFRGGRKCQVDMF